MFFGWGKDFFKELFVNISSPVPLINNVQSLNQFLSNGCNGTSGRYKKFDFNFWYVFASSKFHYYQVAGIKPGNKSYGKSKFSSF